MNETIPDFTSDAARAVLMVHLIHNGLPDWASRDASYALAALCGWPEERARLALRAAELHHGPPQGNPKTGPTDVDRAGIFVELIGFGEGLAVERVLGLMCGWPPERVGRALRAAERAGLLDCACG